MQLPDWLVKSCIGVAGSAALAMGATVIGDARTNATQEKDISTLQSDQKDTTDTLKQLNSTVQSLDKSVAVLNERLHDGGR